MSTKIKLTTVLEAMEISGDCDAYLNIETGETVIITPDVEAYCFDEDEEPELDDKPEWLQEMIREAREAQDSDKYVPLPSRFEIDEWRMMRNFSSMQDHEIREELLNAIHGRGAFRIFKMLVGRLGLLEEWRAYRADAYRQIAISWLEHHNLDYIEDEY